MPIAREETEEERRRRVQQRGAGGLPFVQVRHPSAPGRRERVYGATKEEAIAKANQIARIRHEVRAGELSPREASQLVRRKVGGALTVKEVWDAYAATLSETWGKQVKSVWRYQVSGFFGPDEDGRVEPMYAFDVDDATVRRWEQWLMKKGYKPTTIRNAYDCMHAAFGLAVRGEKLPRMPWTDTGPHAARIGKSTRADAAEDPNKREATRTWEEVQRLMRAAFEIDRERAEGGFYADAFYRVSIVFLLGLRQGEGSALGWDHVEIDGEEPSTWIARINYAARDQWPKRRPDWKRPMDPPKGPHGGKKRTIALNRAAVQILRAHRKNLAAHGFYDAAGPVFPSTKTVHPTAGRWRTHAEVIKPETLRKIVERAGLPNVERWVTHSLRHSFATIEVVYSGGNLRSVQARTGHSDVRTLQTYLHAASRNANQPSFMPDDFDPAMLATPKPPAVRALPLPDELAVAETSPVVDMLDAVAAHARMEEEAQRLKEKRAADRRARAKGKERAHRKSAFEPLIEAWIKAGRPGGKRPAAVTAHANRAYERIYKKSLRDGESPERACSRAKSARNACYAAFAKVVKRLERAGVGRVLPERGEQREEQHEAREPERDPWGLSGGT
jgi:integrase